MLNPGSKHLADISKQDFDDFIAEIEYILRPDDEGSEDTEDEGEA